MKHRRVAGVVLTGFGLLSTACGGALKQQDAEQTSLRHRVEALERKVDALSACDHSPPHTRTLTITGAVLDADGTPASGAVVAVVAADRTSEGDADDAGHFSVDVSAGGDALVYAFKKGRSARLQGPLDPAKPVTLHLVQPGTIEGTFVAPGASGKVVGWIAPGRVSAVLPGLWGRKAIITGDHFEFENVPAGDVEIHLAVADTPASAAHALVHVESGRTSTVQLALQPATSSVVGMVDSASTRQPTEFQAFLLMPDGSPEAWYPVSGGHFGFVGRTPGQRVLLLLARGFKPWRLAVTLEANQELNVGEVLLQPVASNATP